VTAPYSTGDAGSAGAASDLQGSGVSVLIPVLNEEAFIRETAAAMLAQRFDDPIEFLFIDGGSTDGTRPALEEIARENPSVCILDNPRRRTPHALNVGLRHARGAFVARMDAHSWYPPHYLKVGVERLKRGDVDWVTGPAIPRPAGRWARGVALALASPLGQGGSSKWQADTSTPERAGFSEIELDTGVFAGIWRRTTINHYGGWDEDWPVNQDAELAARFLADGRRIVCLSELGAHYAPRNTLRGLAQQYWRFGYYRVKTARRHANALRRAHLLSAGLALTVPVAFAGGRLSPVARLGLAGYVASLIAASVRARRPGRWGEAASLPLVFAIMHLSWGFGFVAGCFRIGVPGAAVARVLFPKRGC
jgi:glycosyltransferase involved in cell wall biosynthesis